MSDPLLTIVCPPKLGTGTHKAEDAERCVWEAVNIAMTGRLTDACPPCTHPVLHAAVMSANDAVSDANRHKVWPYALRALGTRDRDTVEIARTCANFALRVADTACRETAPAALDTAGLHDQAQSLRDLAPITDIKTAAAAAAAAAARAAADAADAAAAVYDAAVYDAVYDARDDQRLALLEALLPG